VEKEDLSHQVRIGLKLPAGNAALDVRVGESMEDGYYQCADIVKDFLNNSLVYFDTMADAMNFGETYSKLYFRLSEARHVPLVRTDFVVKENKDKFYVKFVNKYDSF
jgi:hypothetical protein